MISYNVEPGFMQETRELFLGAELEFPQGIAPPAQVALRVSAQ
jgi:hypothetical protein